jgi:putative aldouronate transport system substrate-binding protein
LRRRSRLLGRHGTGEYDSTWKEYQKTLSTQADLKAYEDELTKEVRRRVEKFGKK